MRARQSIRPHGERRPADTQRMARLPAGQPGVSQSGPDPSLLLRPHLRGARLGCDTPGQKTMFIYCLGQQSTFVYDVTQSGNTHSRGDIPTGQLEHFMSSSNVQNVGTFIELLKMLLELV